MNTTDQMNHGLDCHLPCAAEASHKECRRQGLRVAASELGLMLHQSGPDDLSDEELVMLLDFCVIELEERE